jgi:alkanesulfonate monooxygenase SsuD/methylene tetrahydromethanopterin reductase-like flavin-dependent oxidoreductase (luciferase family)
MKLSLFNLMTQRDASVTPEQIFADTVSMVRLAEEVGFDTAWFAEHHFSNYSICPSPTMLRRPDQPYSVRGRRSRASAL